MTKKLHALFLKTVDQVFTEMKAEKFIYREKSGLVPELTGYRFQTRFGPLVLHPDIPWKLNPEDKTRLRYTVTLFGRFEGIGPFPKGSNGKWNNHFGPRETAQDIKCCIYDLVEAIKGFQKQ